MTFLNAEHLLTQAESLATSAFSGAPRQVNLRRAVSSAYYGFFHFAMISLADEFVGVSYRATARNAIASFRQANQEHRKTFLTLLLCPPR